MLCYHTENTLLMRKSFRYGIGLHDSVLLVEVNIADYDFKEDAPWLISVSTSPAKAVTSQLGSTFPTRWRLIRELL